MLSAEETIKEGERPGRSRKYVLSSPLSGQGAADKAGPIRRGGKVLPACTNPGGHGGIRSFAGRLGRAAQPPRVHAARGGSLARRLVPPGLAGLPRAALRQRRTLLRGGTRGDAGRSLGAVRARRACPGRRRGQRRPSKTLGGLRGEAVHSRHGGRVHRPVAGRLAPPGLVAGAGWTADLGVDLAGGGLSGTDVDGSVEVDGGFAAFCLQDGRTADVLRRADEAGPPTGQQGRLDGVRARLRLYGGSAADFYDLWLERTVGPPRRAPEVGQGFAGVRLGRSGAAICYPGTSWYPVATPRRR